LERELEVARHDANDDVRLAIEEELGSEYVGVGVEAALPGAVAQDGDLLVVLVFVGGEDTAEMGGDAESGEDAGGEPGGGDLRRLAVA
jgi:hypothetical protein